MSEPPSNSSAAHEFERLRGHLTGIAYRMLGSLSEAEDIVQEAYLRWHVADTAEVRSPKAWLVTTVTRLSIDHFRAARRRRESYIGPWLPEPVITNNAGDAQERLDLVEDVSIALLMVLERLAPRERAAFLLHDVFDYGYDEISTFLDAGIANCRQMVHRARKRVRAERPRFEVSPEEERRLVESFMNSVRAADLETLLELFRRDITLWSDGGGKVSAALNPIRGAAAVARFLVGLAGKAPADLRVETASINGAPGLMIYTGAHLFGALVLDLLDGKVREIAVILNPDKLGHLKPEPAGAIPSLD